MQGPVLYDGVAIGPVMGECNKHYYMSTESVQIHLWERAPPTHAGKPLKMKMKALATLLPQRETAEP